MRLKLAEQEPSRSRSLRANLEERAPSGAQTARRALIAARVIFAIAVGVIALRTGKPLHWDGAAFDVYAHAGKLTFGLALVVGVLSITHGQTIARLAGRVPRWALDVIVFTIALISCHFMTQAAFHALPQVQDEIAYDWLARHLAVFDAVPASHPLGEHFRIRFLVDDGRTYPLFQPGWPALLAVFHRLHLTSWAPAFASALWAVSCARLADRLYGRLAAVFAAAVLVCSPFYLFLGGAYFAHPLAAALVAFTLERWIAVFDRATAAPENEGSILRAASAAGIAFAWLIVTRGQIAVATLVPLTLVTVLRGRALLAKGKSQNRGRVLRALGVLVAVGSLGLFLQGAWNLRTTGHALELPQDRYFAMTEAKPGCHRLGFGDDVGCRREHGPDIGPEGFTPKIALDVHEKRWSTFRNDAWGTVIPLALLALCFLRAPTWRAAVIAGAAVAPIALSFFFYYHAIAHGVRLWAESLGPIAIAIGAALAPREETPPGMTLARASSRLLRGVGFAALLPILVVGYAVDAKARAAENGADPMGPRITKNLDEANIHHAIVYVGNCSDVDRGDVVYGWASVLNENPAPSGDRWIVRDFGLAHDRQLAAMYPERRHVRVDCNGVFNGEVPSAGPGDPIVTEWEAKFPADAQEEAFTLIEAGDGAPDKPSNGAVLTIATKTPTAFTSFRQYLPSRGLYLVSVRVMQRMDGGRLALEVDGKVVIEAIPTMGPVAMLTITAAQPITLDAGVHVVTLRAQNGVGAFRTSIDRIEWRPLP